MPAANVGSRWIGGDLEFFVKSSGDRICRIKADGTFDVETNMLTVNSSIVADASGYLGSVTPGTSAASKAVVLDSSSKIDTLDLTAVKIGGVSMTATAAQLNAASKKGSIQLPISLARIIATNDIGVKNATDGGVVSKDTDPILERSNGATDKSMRLSWASASVVEIAFPPIAYPPDIDDTASVLIHVLAKMKSGSVDVPVLTFSAFESTGDSDFGSATAALSTSLQHLTVTLTGANVGTYPNFLTLGVTPAAHNTASNDIYIYGVWVEYTRTGA